MFLKTITVPSGFFRRQEWRRVSKWQWTSKWKKTDNSFIFDHEILRTKSKLERYVKQDLLYKKTNLIPAHLRFVLHNLYFTCLAHNILLYFKNANRSGKKLANRKDCNVNISSINCCPRYAVQCENIKGINYKRMLMIIKIWSDCVWLVCKCGIC